MFNVVVISLELVRLWPDEAEHDGQEDETVEQAEHHHQEEDLKSEYI